MTDIFISYAQEDRAAARRLTQALEAEGQDIWWDREIPAGVTFETFIEQRLGEAACVVVLWSQSSVDSMWVRAEANEAMAQGKLVPVRIDEAQPPLVFRQIQTADLGGWDGEAADPRFRKLVDDIAAAIARRATATAGPATAEPAGTTEEVTEPAGRREPDRNASASGAAVEEEGPGRRRKWPWVMAALLALLLGIGGIWLYPHGPAPPSITRFEALPNAVTAGEPSKLVWETRDAQDVFLQPGGRVQARGTRTVRPHDTTRYTLSARNRGGKTSQSVQVSVQRPKVRARILGFTASPGTVERGQTSRLQWRTEHAVQVELDGKRVEANGALAVSPVQTTVYRLTVTGGSGDRGAAKAKVGVEAATPIQILSFEASIPELRRGEPTILSWRTENAVKVTINDKRRKLSGSLRVRPANTTEFRLLATGKTGEIRDQVITVRVSEPARPSRQWLVLSGGGKPLADARVRKALAVAVGWQRILERLMRGKQVVPALDVPAGSGRQSVAGATQDSAAAKQLLAEAGYPDGFDAYLYVTSERMKDLGEPVAAYLQRIGIKARLGVLRREAALSRAAASHRERAERPVMVLELVSE